MIRESPAPSAAPGQRLRSRWRLLGEEGRKTGHAFSQPGLIIAATALHHGLTVVTRDPGDCQLAPVALVNPWVDPSP